jgi:hypothetical protein
VPLPLTLPGKAGIRGVLQGTNAFVCYNLTFSDEVIRELVWWDQGRQVSRAILCSQKKQFFSWVKGSHKRVGKALNSNAKRGSLQQHSNILSRCMCILNKLFTEQIESSA